MKTPNLKKLSAGHSPNIERYTPLEIFTELNTTFDLDVCAPPPRIHCPSKEFCNEFFYKDGGDALEKEWFGRVWMNPPFERGEVGKWVKKLSDHGNGIAMVTSYFTSAWFQDNPPDGVLLLADRPRYIVPKTDGSTVTERYPSMLMSYGKECCDILAHTNLKGHYYARPRV